MNVTLLRVSSRPVAIAAVIVGMVSLAIGAHAALNLRSLDAAKESAAASSVDTSKKASRIALGDRQRPLSRRQCAAVAADQRRPRADLRAAPRRFRRRRHRGCQQGRHDPRGGPAQGKSPPRQRGDAVLRRLRHPGGPRKLHDPGRRRDLEGKRRPPQRRLDRIRARGDEGAGRLRQARRHRRRAPQPLSSAASAPSPMVWRRSPRPTTR